MGGREDLGRHGKIWEDMGSFGKTYAWEDLGSREFVQIVGLITNAIFLYNPIFHYELRHLSIFHIKFNIRHNRELIGANNASQSSNMPSLCSKL